MTSLASHSGATSPTTLRRRSGRERPQVLTSAFHRYVERVQSATDPTPRTDLAATLRLAAEIVGSGRIDAAAVAEHGPEIRQLARNVRQAGRGAAAQPALLASTIVLARKLVAASAPADAPERRVLAGAAR